MKRRTIDPPALKHRDNRCLAKPGTPYSLTCEYYENPIGIDAPQPRLSWVVNDESQGAVQRAYQIEVVSENSFVESISEAEPDVWDTGKIISDQSILIPYGGPPLGSDRRYHWRVRTWNGSDAASPWSKWANWTMGLLHPSDWKAEWIALTTGGDDRLPNGSLRSMAARRELRLRDEIRSATVYATGLGVYELRINGQRVGEDILAPGWTYYPTRIQYQTYDVTTLVHGGWNAISATVGNGWWSGGLGPEQNWRFGEGPLRLLTQLHVVYWDGTEDTIVTDESWKCHPSPIVFDSLYDGETYDTRLEQRGWDCPRFDDKGWSPVQVIESGNVRLVSQQEPPIRCTQYLKPTSITEPRPGTYLVDFGQNFAGRVSLEIRKGVPGAEVVMRHAEELNPDGTLYTENLRTAKATDRYIIRGDRLERWEPHFTYHGFRYVEITGYPGKLNAASVRGKVYHTDLWDASFLRISDPLIDTIHQNILWGQRSNLCSVPTDCPQRDERLGWMGDAQIFANTACWNMEMAPLYLKWMNDIADSRLPNGAPQNVNPGIGNMGPASPAWGDSVIIIPWVVYLHTADIRIIERYFEDMMAWVEYMRANSEGGLLFLQEGFGDWVSVVPSPKPPISAAYYYLDCVLLSKMAKIIGREAVATKLAERAARIKEAFNARFLNLSECQAGREKACYEGNTQTANAVPLQFGLVPDELRQAVADNLARKVEADGFHPTTGFIGTAYLLPALTANGHNETAFRLIKQTNYPSWGYMIEKGATTIWELWNSDTEGPDMNSRNHFAFGSIGEWFYETLAGIRIDPENPGFKRFIVRPYPVRMPAEGRTLGWVACQHETLYGIIRVNWDLYMHSFRLEVAVPANTAAAIHVPLFKSRRAVVRMGKDLLVKKGRTMSEVPGLIFKGIQDDCAVFEAAAGTYRLVAEKF